MKTRLISFLAFAALACCAAFCGQVNKSNMVILEGKVSGLPDGILYLGDIYRPAVVMDSAVVKNGEFSFHLAVNDDFEPLFVQLYFNRQGNLEPLIFDSDDVLAANGKAFYTNGFMLERGATAITGVYKGFSPCC
ncbi:protein of unknown function [Chitinophaga terrae (ex Kim and Jung 2007)]|uniref:DUF4369 domain-containing protein n=1 Tax=Chitinophaga terrae (ex Kim and Jung 2007) TaxID=408074 RepID=A0A1H4GD67_9BACT|nr:DUF4369 domain-containing protein [Chitinophaga terrae (ex Kim and Jung 2007)]SEB07573.1 protein of unknown function [Chitinophaga terrae (ex Kim and Jung 2007)]